MITKDEINKTFGLNSVIQRMLSDSENNNKHKICIPVFYFSIITDIGTQYLCLWKMAITFFILFQNIYKSHWYAIIYQLT